MKVIQSLLFAVCMLFVGACTPLLAANTSSHSFSQEDHNSVEVNWMGDDTGIIYAYVVGSISKEALEKDAEAHCQQYQLTSVYWKDKETDYTFVMETLFKCERPEYVQSTEGRR